MPQGDKSSYTGKQKRKAEHIEDSYRKRGVSEKEAEERAWRTVNKQDGGAKKKSGSRSKKSGSSSRKSGGSRKRTTAKRTTSRKRS
jgi:plasmid stabilization system protein ParE